MSYINPSEAENTYVQYKNNDNMCTMWSLLANEYYETINNNHKSEVQTYKQYFD